MTVRPSFILLEALCVLAFVAGGIVIGFCLGGLLGPGLFGRGGHGLEELGFMFNGAILGAGSGLLFSVAAGVRWPRRKRVHAAIVAVALGALAAAVTFVAVNVFGAW